MYVTDPSDGNDTEPCVPWVTLVNARPASSKLSALAPFVPVIRLAVTAVSSAVVRLSAAMSATAVTVTDTVAVSTLPSPDVTV